nr:hypothetical protein [Tanacetum cinerariifolium]
MAWIMAAALSLSLFLQIVYGPLIWPTVEVEGVTRVKKYSELSDAEAIQADCDVKTTNIILQGLPPEVYALKGETLCDFYLRFSRLLKDMNMYNMKLEQFQVNTKFLNTLLSEWRVTRLKKYSELSAAEAIQADCDVKATNIILQGLPLEVYALVSTHKVAKELWERIQMLMQRMSLTKQERECKLYDAFDKFAYQKGETLRDFYLRFSLLLNDMNMYNIKLEQFQVNTKFLNTLPSEWSKFVTDVKLLRDLLTTSINQLHAYLGQHEYHANEVRLMHERTSDPLTLISQHQLKRTPYQHHQPLYNQSQFQQHVTSYQSSPYATTYHNPQFVSQGSSSQNSSISYPVNDTSSTVNHSAYMAPAPQIEYALIAYNPLEFSSPETGLVVPVFQKGYDLDTREIFKF